MTRPAESFAVGAVALLAFALLSRFIVPKQLGISVHWHGTGYVFAPGSACIIVAAFLCGFAAVYSLWMFPMNQKAAMWHFWLTSGGIAVFWFSFYALARGLVSRVPSAANLSGTNAAAAYGQIVSVLVVVLAQAVFIVNFILCIAKIQKSHQ